MNLGNVETVLEKLSVVGGNFLVTDISSVKTRVAKYGRTLFGDRYVSRIGFVTTGVASNIRPSFK